MDRQFCEERKVESRWEQCVSWNQNLTFAFAAGFFARRELPFEAASMRSFGITNADSLYTNLALLLSDQCEHSIQAAVFQGTRKDIVRERAEFCGSVLKQLEDACAFVARRNNLHAHIEGLYRIDIYDYPLAAVREGLINAVVHRDYGAGGPILVSILDNRLEILNQGGLMPSMTVEEVRRGVSDPRNKALADVFYRLKLTDAFGTCWDKMDSAYEGSGKQAHISVTQNSFRLTLPNVNYTR